MGETGETVRIGISACLLGREVRYDGGHKRDAFLTESLAPHVQWVPFCPELEVGMGVPRPPLRLAGDPAHPRLLTRTGADWTEPMERHARERARALHHVHGAVFKKDSPSCGLFRVKIHPEVGPPARGGTGLFAAAFVAANPLVPAEEEGRLNDPALRENFVERVFAYRRLHALLEQPMRIDRWMAFHAAHKYQLLAHSTVAYRELGRLVAQGGETLPAAYAWGFLRALAAPAPRQRHVNVLQHVLGHFKRQLSPGDKAEALGLVDDYRRGLVPLVVPLTLVQHFLRLHPDEWLAAQTYLAPYPRELLLRNAV